MKRDAEVRVLRDNVVIYTGRIISLRRFKDDANEVRAGFECGVGISNFNDVKVGDILECFKMEKSRPLEVPRPPDRGRQPEAQKRGATEIVTVHSSPLDFAGAEMPIGLLTLEIHIPDAQSLKDKRQVLRSLKDRLRAHFNVAVAELEHQELWQRSRVGVVSISGDGKHLEESMQAIAAESERVLGRDLVSHEIEYFEDSE